MPLLTYGLNVIYLSASQLNKLNIAWNNVYKEDFWYEAVGVSKKDTVSVWSA